MSAPNQEGGLADFGKIGFRGFIDHLDKGLTHDSLGSLVVIRPKLFIKAFQGLVSALAPVEKEVDFFQKLKRIDLKIIVQTPFG